MMAREPPFSGAFGMAAGTRRCIADQIDHLYLSHGSRVGNLAVNRRCSKVLGIVLSQPVLTRIGLGALRCSNALKLAREIYILHLHRLGGSGEAARAHCMFWRSSGRLAAHGARPTTGTGDWHLSCTSATLCRKRIRNTPGLERTGLC